MNIGFDLDGIFVGLHPLIPKEFIEWLYKGPQNHKPRYRFPSTQLEQNIRIWSHIALLRPKISGNAEFLKELSADKKNNIFLISSRYEFLTKQTLSLFKKYDLENYFFKIYLNSQNEQPHLFKKAVLEKLNLDIFVEDDLMLLQFLQKFFPKTKLLWYNPNNTKRIPSGILHIKSLKEILPYL